MPVTSDEFREALAKFASGVTVVTTSDASGELFGLTVSAFCSVSLEPPLILVCIEKTTRCHDAFRDAGRFVVNILGEDQKDVSERFASQATDKFSGTMYGLNTRGIPVLEGSIAIIECRLSSSYEGGDHTIFVAEVENAAAADNGPLVYFNSEYRGIRN